MHASAYTGADRISIHAAREGGDGRVVSRSLKMYISIHAAREGGDTVPCHGRWSESISIHAAREGGDDEERPQP